MFIAIAAMLLASVAVVEAQSPDAFLLQLQRAAQADDRAAIAGMIRYPITISIAGFRIPFADAAGFLARYDDIFTPTLFDGIARGSDDVTVEMVNGQWRITEIAVPRPASGGSAAVAPPGQASSGAAARKQEPRRIAIRVGPRATQIPGLLYRDGSELFVLHLPKGQLAGVRLERVPAGSAVLRVVHARTGAPLGARSSANGRFVSGRPPESADYRIEVRRTGTQDDVPLPYMLSLTLR
jgi:hypothetical protein